VRAGAMAAHRTTPNDRAQSALGHGAAMHEYLAHALVEPADPGLPFGPAPSKRSPCTPLTIELTAAVLCNTRVTHSLIESAGHSQVWRLNGSGRGCSGFTRMRAYGAGHRAQALALLARFMH
jgi:hypothetical protein